MSTIAERYYQRLWDIMRMIRVTTGTGQAVNFYEAIELAGRLVSAQAEVGRKVMFIGNGASAAISGHMAADFSKNGKMRAMAFNDAPLVTALANDVGYQHVFAHSISMFADEGDVLFAISSSGRSENVLKGVQAAVNKACPVITLSGFESTNPLCVMGEINFYVPGQHYGPVEVIHHSICHSILDVMLFLADPKGETA